MEYEKGCQGRKFVLGFVIKSQKTLQKERMCRNVTILDKRGRGAIFGSKYHNLTKKKNITAENTKIYKQ